MKLKCDNLVHTCQLSRSVPWSLQVFHQISRSPGSEHQISGPWEILVSLAVVFSIVTQRSSRCLTILKTAARETREIPTVALKIFSLTSLLWRCQKGK